MKRKIIQKDENFVRFLMFISILILIGCLSYVWIYGGDTGSGGNGFTNRMKKYYNEGDSPKKHLPKAR